MVHYRRKSKWFIAVSLFINLLAAPVWSQDRDAMIAKAKEEKEFVYYSTTDIRDGTAMVHAFQKKYPFIEPNFCVSVARKSLSKFFRNTAAAPIYSTSSRRPAFSSTKSSKKIYFKSMNHRNGVPLSRTSKTRTV